jgi:hypothetical protein
MILSSKQLHVQFLLTTVVAPSALAFLSTSIGKSHKLSFAPKIFSSRQLLHASTVSSSPLSQNEDAIFDSPGVDNECKDVVVASSTVPKKTYSLDDGFIFGLENSGLERPRGKQALLVLEDDTLETKPYQVAVVMTTFFVHAMVIFDSATNIYANYNYDLLVTAAVIASLMFSSWILADMGSGIFHWSVDNYGNGNTPLLGSIIAAFQGHHTAPWTITHRSFCNNTYKLCVPFGIPTILAIYAVTGPMVTLFLACFCVLEICSQEFHKWSHMTKKEVPQWVNVLQDLGVTVNRKQHAQHHMAPYEGNYCIVSGACNDFLDSIGFFRRLEKLVFDLVGVESNAWKLDPELRSKTLRGDYNAN